VDGRHRAGHDEFWEIVMRHARPFAALALCLLLASGAVAQEFPTRPVTMVVPFAAGGPIDLLGRLIQPALAAALGQPVVIENITGGGGMTGANRVRQATPDGYQIVLGSIGTHTLSPLLAKHPPYDPARDFAPVGLVAEIPLVLLVRKNLPAQNLQEFIAYVKANHATMQFGSGGTGTSSHIGCVLLDQTIGVEVTHVPYRGGGPALTDLMAGRLDYLCNYISLAVQAVGTGEARALAIFARERAPVMPNLPTAAEQGLNGVDAYTWNAIFAPKGTPPAVIARLNAALSKALDDPTVRDRLARLGLDVPPKDLRTPDYLGRYVASEMVKWAPAVKASGAGLE
jgi:tripartite-type tricarboxylate transporter receptor subunit TctC